MTIRNRLKLIGLMPIVLLMLIASYFLFISYDNYIKAESLKAFMLNNKLVSDVLVEVSKERSITALCLGSNKNEFQNSLKIQRKLVDSSFFTLRDKATSDINDKSETEKYQNMLNGISGITKLREIVDTRSQEFKEIYFNGYTDTIILPILQSYYQLNNVNLDIDMSLLVNLLSQLTAVKENIGIERGFVSYFIQKKSPMTREDFLKWNIYKRDSFAFSIEKIDDILNGKLNSILEGAQAKEIFSEFAMMSASIQSQMSHGNYSIDVMNWFTLQTKRISLFSEAEKIIVEELFEKSNHYLYTQLVLFIVSMGIWLSSLILLYLGYIITQDISKNIKELEHVLNKAIKEIKNDKYYEKTNMFTLDNIELDTYKGTKKAYAFLEALIGHAREEKMSAQEANKAKSLFLANMSHEIRTPLNGIVGFAEILKGTDLSIEQREYLSIIDDSSGNLLNIINSILDISKIESSNIELEYIQFNAEKEFISTIESCKSLASEKMISLHYYMDPTIGRILKGDPTRIKEILTNLLSNAIKFTNNHGEVILEIEKSADTTEIVFSVQDNGIGITKEQQEYIFDAFLQADASVTREYGGTGLGLTISRQLVELMGGHLNLESIEGKGSKFFFSLPLEVIEDPSVDYTNIFKGQTIGRFMQSSPSKSDMYMEIYFEHLGLTVKNFKSAHELQMLYENNICQSFWIIMDKLELKIIDTIAKLDQSKFHIIVDILYRKEIEEAGISKDIIHPNPITLSKLKKVLSNNTDDKMQEKEEVPHELDIKFDAKVLVAEDNTVNQRLIKHILNTYGMTIELANNGQECFDMYKNNSYDLIMMDIQMPKINGIEATHLIIDYENEGSLPHTPIIALTANALKGDKERFLKEGMDAYIMKPIQPSELFQILKHFLFSKMNTLSKKEEGELHLDIKGHFPTVLIAKKSSLLNRILARYIENMHCNYKVLINMEHLEEELCSYNYDIVFTDEKVITKYRPKAELSSLVVTHIRSLKDVKKIINTIAQKDH